MKKVLFLLAFAAANLYLQWQLFILESERERVMHENTALKEENDEQRIRNEQLKGQLADLQETPHEAFEELARERLLMIKSDEIYVLPQSESR